MRIHVLLHFKMYRVTAIVLNLNVILKLKSGILSANYECVTAKQQKEINHIYRVARSR